MAYAPNGSAIVATGDATSVTSLATAASAIAAGDWVLVAVSCENDGGTITVTDTVGNTYAAVDVKSQANGFSKQEFWTYSSGTNASNVITAHNTTSQPRPHIVAQRYTGLANAAPQAVGTVNVQNSPTPATDVLTASVTATGQPAALIGISYNDYNEALTAGTGFTLRSSDLGSGGYNSSIEDMRITTTGAKNVTFTMTLAAANWATRAIVVAESGGGAVNARNGIALSGISAINGITKSGVSAINGLTI